MDKIKYMIKKIFKTRFSKFFQVVKECGRRSRKLYTYIILDIIYCRIKHGAGYMDYYMFEMYNLTDQQRGTYVTKQRNKELVDKYNDKKRFELINNKYKFNNLFQKYLKRDWIYLKKSSKEKGIDWIKNHDVFVAKSVLGNSGKEIKKVITSRYKNYEKLYNELIGNNYTLLEEYITQHDDLMGIYPDSLNTIRLVTVLANDKINYIAAYLRIGNGNFTDDLNNGGMIAPINIQTGTIEFDAADKNGKIYDKHPVTETEIVGFKIPYWKECLKMINYASEIVNEVAYCGWDIAIKNDGPCIVAATPFPGHEIYQLPIHLPDKIGLMPKFESIEK